jgi:hypothetical protein
VKEGHQEVLCSTGPLAYELLLCLVHPEAHPEADLTKACMSQFRSMFSSAQGPACSVRFKGHKREVPGLL